MTAVGFWVVGMPAPQGSKKAVGRAASGRTILVESSAKVKPWRQDVVAAAVAARTAACPLDGPLALVVTFFLPRPASAPKRRLWPDRKPDLDKLLRSTMDAIGTAGLWVDDARVVRVEATKLYVGDRWALPVPGAVVGIAPKDLADPRERRAHNNAWGDARQALAVTS